MMDFYAKVRHLGGGTAMVRIDLITYVADLPILGQSQIYFCHAQGESGSLAVEGTATEVIAAIQEQWRDADEQLHGMRRTYAVTEPDGAHTAGWASPVDSAKAST